MKPFFEKISYLSYFLNICLLGVIIFLLVRFHNQSDGSESVPFTGTIKASVAVAAIESYEQNFLATSTAYPKPPAPAVPARYLTIHDVSAVASYCAKGGPYEQIVAKQMAYNNGKLPDPIKDAVNKMEWRLGFYAMSFDGIKHTFCVVPILCEIDATEKSIVDIIDFMDETQKRFLYTYQKGARKAEDDTSIYDMGQVWP